MAPTTSTTHLPEYHEWMGSPEWRAHLMGHDQPAAGCPGCEVRPMLKAIHAFYFASTTTSGQFVGLYSLADGYGAPGTIPEQGYDWSGVRDSSPAAVARMFAYVETQEV